MTEFRCAYQYDVDLASVETGLMCEADSLTVQADAAETDINLIVKRFGVTGTLPQGVRLPSYEDFTGQIFDFRSAQEVLMAARDEFMKLPPGVRARFANDPQEFLEFCEDKANLPELRQMGLAKPEEPAAEAAPVAPQEKPKA